MHIKKQDQEGKTDNRNRLVSQGLAEFFYKWPDRIILGFAGYIQSLLQILLFFSQLLKNVKTIFSS